MHENVWHYNSIWIKFLIRCTRTKTTLEGKHGSSDSEAKIKTSVSQKKTFFKFKRSLIVSFKIIISTLSKQIRQATTLQIFVDF